MDDSSDAETLASVLAFLDAYDADACTVDANASTGVQRLSVSSIQRREPSRNGDKRQRLPRNAPGYTTALQRQKRAELAALREQVAELESYLAQLQRGQNTHPHDSGSAVVPVGSRKNAKRWLKAAIEERRLRFRAESANRKLKAMVDHEFELQAAILRLVRRHRRSPEVNDLLATHGCQTDHFSNPLQFAGMRNEICVSTTDIQTRLMALQLDTPRIFGMPVNDSVVSCSMETKTIADIGQFIEIRTATTTEHRSAASATSFYWRECDDTPIEVWKYLDEDSPNGDAFSRKSVLTLRRGHLGSADAVHLNVQHHARKIESANQAVVVMVALIRVPVAGICLREDFWTRITDRAKQQVVVETCYRIYQGDHASNGHGTSKTADMNVFVSTSLAQITRHNMLAAQNWLLNPHTTRNTTCCWLPSNSSQILHPDASAR